MDLKPGEIALLVAAIAVPAIFLILALTPGGLSFVGDFAMSPTNMPWVFFGGAALLFGVLAFRIYRRIRPAKKKPVAKSAHISPTPKFTLRRAADGEKPREES